MKLLTAPSMDWTFDPTPDKVILIVEESTREHEVVILVALQVERVPVAQVTSLVGRTNKR